MSDQLIDLSHMAAKPFKGLDLLFKSVIGSKVIPFVWGLFIVHFVMQLALYDHHSPCNRTLSLCNKYVAQIGGPGKIFDSLLIGISLFVVAKILANGIVKHGISPHALVPFLTYYAVVHGLYLFGGISGILGDYTVPSTDSKTATIIKEELAYGLHVFGNINNIDLSTGLNFTGGGSNIWFILALAVLIANHSR